jgi:hypothetical protein
MTKDEEKDGCAASALAASIAKLPELLRKPHGE